MTKQVKVEDENKVPSEILTALSHSFVRKEELVALTIMNNRDIRACYEQYDDDAESGLNMTTTAMKTISKKTMKEPKALE